MKVFISPSFSMNSFARYRLLWLTLFYFRHFEYLASILSGQQRAVNLIEDSLYMMSFLLLLSSSLFIFVVWQFMMCLSVNLFEFILLQVCWTSWMYRSMSLIKFGKFGAIISSNIIFVPLAPLLLGLPFIYMLVPLILSQRSLMFCWFFHYFCFLPLRLDNIN